jgi:hypothetical protein
MRAYDELPFSMPIAGSARRSVRNERIAAKKRFHLAEIKPDMCRLARRKHFSFSVTVERHSSTNGSLIRPEADQ